MGLASVSAVTTSCVDEIKFGNSFLEKAPGGTATQDTVFNNAEYTRQFLTNLYGKQYYGLPYGNVSPETSNSYLGKFDALTDCYIFTYDGGIISNYYQGKLTANHGIRSNRFHYLNNQVWEAVRMYWMLEENIGRVPGMDDAEKKSIIAQAKCITASRYFDIFRHYGGVPILEKTYTGFEESYEFPRNTVEEVVNYMVKLVDEAAPVLPWTVEVPDVETGRWTRAAALALKCKILQYAASPLFNDDEPYYPGATDATVWYGAYKPELWKQCLEACEAFFTENAGRYYLVQAEGKKPQDYRLAYRKAYAKQESPEILLSVRVTTTSNDSKYGWYNWGYKLDRGYSPTQEYMEMFPWKDGKPFNWEETKADGKLDEMFVTGTMKDKNLELTRDPRLYEEIIVNGQPDRLSWTSASMSGNSSESWVGGTNAGEGPSTQNGKYLTGYAPIKYLMGADFNRMYTQWAALRLSDLYLTYAEALCQTNETGDMSDAIAQIDIVRARVGLKGLKECNPDKNLNDKEVLLEEILRERACELGMEDSRFFDLTRYKRADIFAKQLHGLRIYRLNDQGERVKTPWYKGDKKQPYPTHFDYEVFPISNPVHYWWANGFDPKWFLSPFPSTEINKGYGLVQNPGW